MTQTVRLDCRSLSCMLPDSSMPPVQKTLLYLFWLTCFFRVCLLSIPLPLTFMWDLSSPPFVVGVDHTVVSAKPHLYSAQKHCCRSANPWPAILCIHYAHLFKKKKRISNHLIFSLHVFSPPNHNPGSERVPKREGERHYRADNESQSFGVSQLAVGSCLPHTEPWLAVAALQTGPWLKAKWEMEQSGGKGKGFGKRGTVTSLQPQSRSQAIDALMVLLSAPDRNPRALHTHTHTHCTRTHIHTQT